MVPSLPIESRQSKRQPDDPIFLHPRWYGHADCFCCCRHKGKMAEGGWKGTGRHIWKASKLSINSYAPILSNAMGNYELLCIHATGCKLRSWSRRRTVFCNLAGRRIGLPLRESHSGSSRTVFSAGFLLRSVGFISCATLSLQPRVRLSTAGVGGTADGPFSISTDVVNMSVSNSESLSGLVRLSSWLLLSSTSGSALFVSPRRLARPRSSSPSLGSRGCVTISCSLYGSGSPPLRSLLRLLQNQRGTALSRQSSNRSWCTTLDFFHSAIRTRTGESTASIR